MNNAVRKDVIESLGGIEDTIRPLEASLRQHEMRPFDIEPTYYEDFTRNRIKQKPDGRGSRAKELGQAIKFDDIRGETRSEFLKKTMTDKNFQMNNGSIVSASPFRAIIRRKNYIGTEQKLDEESSSKSDEDKEEAVEEEEDQFDRDMNGLSLHTGRDIFTTGRMVGENVAAQEVNELLRDESLAAPGARKPNELSESERAILGIYPGNRGQDQRSNRFNNSQLSGSVNEDSQIMRLQRNSFLKQFNEKRIYNKNDALNLNNLNIESGITLPDYH